MPTSASTCCNGGHDAVLARELSFARHGAQLLPGLAVPLLADLIRLADRAPRNRAGTRIVGDDLAARLLAPGSAIGGAVA